MPINSLIRRRSPLLSNNHITNCVRVLKYLTMHSSSLFPMPPCVPFFLIPHATMHSFFLMKFRRGYYNMPSYPLALHRAQLFSILSTYVVLDVRDSPPNIKSVYIPVFCLATSRLTPYLVNIISTPSLLPLRKLIGLRPICIKKTEVGILTQENHRRRNYLSNLELLT